jgi:hypothetical protein
LAAPAKENPTTAVAIRNIDRRMFGCLLFLLREIHPVRTAAMHTPDTVGPVVLLYESSLESVLVNAVHVSQSPRVVLS